jgi:exodeoxyribonuclease V alpha subunit
LCHTRDYIQIVKDDVSSGAGGLSTGDTDIGENSLEAALMAVGGLIPREEHNAVLEAVLPMIRSREGKQHDRIRVVFEGGPVEYAEADVAQLRHAYACTCHKMQGSQAKAVVVGLSKPHWYMLNRTLLYTAVTRAEQVCIIVCDKRSLIRAIRNKGNFQRATMLPHLLAGG